MTIGENIRRIRKEKGMTQKQLGELCQMMDSQIRIYESGRQIPKTEKLEKIAHALQCSVCDLWEKAGQFNEKQVSKDIKCDDCEKLSALEAENRRLKKEQDIIFLLLDLGMSAVELWAENNGLLSGKEDVEKTFPDGNDKIRMLLDQIGEPGKNPRMERFASLLKLL